MIKYLFLLLVGCSSTQNCVQCEPCECYREDCKCLAPPIHEVPTEFPNQPLTSY